MFCANNFESVKVASIDKKLWCKGLFWNSSFCFFLFPPFFQVSDQFYFLIYFDKISSFAFLESMFPALVRPVSYHHSFSSIAAHLPFLCCLYTFALQVWQTISYVPVFFLEYLTLFTRSEFPPGFLCIDLLWVRWIFVSEGCFRVCDHPLPSSYRLGFRLLNCK